jgi:endonuclease YncB( thermonuclease family)
MDPMEPIDPERKRQRLSEVYANMADGELEELAEDYEELTNVARKALKDEIERRGLSIDLDDSPPATDDTELLELVTIRNFRDFNEARLAKGLLESAAIECFMTDENIAGLEIPIADIRLQVKSNDVKAALEILDQSIPEESDNEE